MSGDACATRLLVRYQPFFLLLSEVEKGKSCIHTYIHTYLPSYTVPTQGRLVGKVKAALVSCMILYSVLLLHDTRLDATREKGGEGRGRESREGCVLAAADRQSALHIKIITTARWVGR